MAASHKLKKSKPALVVIFGASGDLTKRKLIPAIYKLFCQGLISEEFGILGVSRTPFSDESFREKVVFDNPHLEDDSELEAFAQKVHYEAIDTASAEDYAIVKERVEALDQLHSTGGNVIFYLSTPPKFYSIIPRFLAQQGLNRQDKGIRRLVIEKPFGVDEASAKQLNKDLLENYDENQIYRIDHYLGKETVQNMLVTRFSNGIFEPLWNRNYIDHIEITNAESIGVENRGGYYDQSGALRDMVQNHLFQILAHLAMEPPISLDAHAIRDEKIKLLKSIRPISGKYVSQQVIRGQYVESEVGGQEVSGYRSEKDVAEDSQTETFVALQLFIDNWRWADVPFYIRSGKRMPTRVTEVTIAFKSPPYSIFPHESVFEEQNKLIIRIQPDEGIAIRFGMKVPGSGFKVNHVDMDFHYSELQDKTLPEAYERLILDCLRGDATLFSRGDAVEQAWAIIDPIIEAWKNDPANKLYGYPAGSWGPESAQKLFQYSEKSWHDPCPQLSDSGYCEL